MTQSASATIDTTPPPLDTPPAEWKYPGQIPGWLSLSEGQRLRDLARDKMVLEIGSFAGRSTVCMGQVATAVYTIDPHTLGNHIRSDFLLRENLAFYGLRQRVFPMHGRTEDFEGIFQPRLFDLVFVDGDHTQMYVCRDTAFALRIVKVGGTIAWHDWNEVDQFVKPMFEDNVPVVRGELRTDHEKPDRYTLAEWQA